MATPSSLVPKNNLDGFAVDRHRAPVFPSVDEESRYMIDGKIFDPVRIDQQVKLGSIEAWTLKSTDDDDAPFQLHVNDFQVMSVNAQPYDAHGLQDTVLIPSHGEVGIRTPFNHFAGKSPYHCHSLFHGMAEWGCCRGGEIATF